MEEDDWGSVLYVLGVLVWTKFSLVLFINIHTAQEVWSCLKDRSWVQTLTTPFKFGAHPLLTWNMYQNFSVNNINVVEWWWSGDLRYNCVAIPNLSDSADFQCADFQIVHLFRYCLSLEKRWSTSLIVISKENITHCQKKHRWDSTCLCAIWAYTSHRGPGLVLGGRLLVHWESLQTTPSSTGTTCARVAPSTLDLYSVLPWFSSSIK